MRPARVVPHPRRLGALLLAVVLLSSCAATNGEVTASKRSPQRVEVGEVGGELGWTTCTEPPASLGGLECAALAVPIDHGDPGGTTLTLALARIRSTGAPEDRIGSLLFNPGGPGGSGVDFLANVASTIPSELAERFDLVSFDPRGVGASSPVRCLDDAARDAQFEGDLSPDTDAELEDAVTDQLDYVEACEREAGEVLRHMSTADVATDLDLIRESLGDEQLSYVGFSYGTLIGATYATLFPERVRALVLDASVSPGASAEEELLAQGKGFEGTLANFVAACDDDPECALAPDAGAAIAAARAALEREPVTVESGSGPRTMGVDLFDIALATALYDTTVWGTTATAIAQLRDGGAAVLFSLVDRQIGRNPDGTYDNSSDAQAMVNCADLDERPTLEEGRAIAERVQDQLPTFGPALAWSALACLDWPSAANPLPEIDSTGAPTILVVGTLGDPATPYEWSVAMSERLADSVLLTYEGDGHTAFLRGGPCIDDAVIAYLVELTAPAEGTSCPAAEDSVSFGGLRSEVIEQFVTAGLPESVAGCIVDRIIDEVGAGEFDRMILAEEIERLSELVTRHTLACAAGG